MTIQRRPAAERGSANFGWLDSKHSFSFGQYYDPENMGVSALRVINEDTVLPGTGFDTHGHNNMEILSYVLQGTIEHKDSMGNKQQIPAGDFQIMSAGTGVTHSEYNPSTSQTLHFLQIWLLPNEQDVTPRYDQKAFADQKGLTAIIHPTVKGALRAHSDAQLWRYQGGEISALNAEGTQFYVQVVKGVVEINGERLNAGDGIRIDQAELIITADKDAEALVFDLP